MGPEVANRLDCVLIILKEIETLVWNDMVWTHRTVFLICLNLVYHDIGVYRPF